MLDSQNPVYRLDESSSESSFVPIFWPCSNQECSTALAAAPSTAIWSIARYLKDFLPPAIISLHCFVNRFNSFVGQFLSTILSLCLRDEYNLCFESGTRSSAVHGEQFGSAMCDSSSSGPCLSRESMAEYVMFGIAGVPRQRHDRRVTKVRRDFLLDREFRFSGLVP